MLSSTHPIKCSAFYLTVALVILSCGGTGQDAGERKNFQQTIQGVAIDGYLARATVFLDYDNNSTRDPWEPFAFTDDNGYFSYNPLTDTDYCAADADSQFALYCLRNTRSLAEAVLRIDGGYDVLTGEPFIGQLSRRIDISNSDNPVNVLVSPLTSLLTNLRTTTERASILTLLGLDEADLDVDFMNTDGANTVDSELLNATIKTHKAVSLLANLLENQYSEIGSQAGAANDLSSSIYRHLAHQMISRSLELDNMLNDSEAISAVMSAAEQDVLNIYEQWDMLLPQQPLTNYSRVLQQSVQLVQTINQVIPPSQTLTSFEDIQGRVRLVETLTIKALDEASQGNSFHNAVNFIQDANNQHLLASLIENLGHTTSDLTRLVRHNFIGEDLASADAIRNLVRLPQNAVPFSQIAGRQLRVSDMDLGFAPNHLNDSEVELYFHATDTVDRGSFDACVKYIKEAQSNGKLGDANTRGKLVSGYWSLLDAGRNNGGSYSLLLNIEFLGAVYQAILKPAGTANVQNTSMQVIRFDHAGKLRAWHSADGLQNTTTLPATDADCEQRLPSRIGI